MLRSILADRKIMVFALLALLIRLFSLSEVAVERFYTYGIYQPISIAFRYLLGWVPFSVGDILYMAAVVFLIAGAVRLVRGMRTRKKRMLLLLHLLRYSIRAVLGVYVVFQLLWGLNYSRQGIAAQLGLEARPYTKIEVNALAAQLQDRLEETAPLVDSVVREQLNSVSCLEKEGVAAFAAAERKYPFLNYRAPAVKASLFTPLGHLIGFTGYYNPFSAEAQIKTSIPVFLKPFVANHEIAHQLGYAKESEANFVSFLAGRESVNNDVRYSVYFELFLYTLSDLRRRDTALAAHYRKSAHPRVKADLKALADYLERSRNPVEPYMARVYDAYLRRNNQPKGRMSYNQVVMWLVAYAKKYGRRAI